MVNSWPRIRILILIVSHLTKILTLLFIWCWLFFNCSILGFTRWRRRKLGCNHQCYFPYFPPFQRISSTFNSRRRQHCGCSNSQRDTCSARVWLGRCSRCTILLFPIKPSGRYPKVYIHNRYPIPRVTVGRGKVTNATVDARLPRSRFRF